ncbi:hypothetical protein [Blattabacterium cuenoti]|uniref:hypothetical protein n=1 Tax=Blattabacterium cuenoti TaxID=1653831 RepID=UPI00163D36D4|nr:hypothetical protein [Blattabacterium cuenoti]
MKFKERKTKVFEKVIKNGKYLFFYPVLSVFLSEKSFEKKLSINLVGTIVKKKILKNQFKEIE